jgi:hypothetical protein
MLPSNQTSPMGDGEEQDSGPEEDSSVRRALEEQLEEGVGGRTQASPQSVMGLEDDPLPSFAATATASDSMVVPAAAAEAPHKSPPARVVRASIDSPPLLTGGFSSSAVGFSASSSQTALPVPSAGSDEGADVTERDMSAVVDDLGVVTSSFDDSSL